MIQSIKIHGYITLCRYMHILYIILIFQFSYIITFLKFITIAALKYCNHM